MKMISLIAVALLLAATSAYAQTSSKYKVSLYKSCQEACVEKQIKAAANKPFLDVPFVFEHYCGCYCSRFAMRLSVEDAEVLARLALEENQSKATKEFVSRWMRIQRFVWESSSTKSLPNKNGLRGHPSGWPFSCAPILT